MESTNQVETAPPVNPVEAEALAQLFHDTYERLAPQFGYETREASQKPWEDVPPNNKALMVATCAEILTAAAELTPIKPHTSDGYHNFAELYQHRHALVLTLLDLMDSSLTWWSEKHHPQDGPIYEGYVIVGMMTEDGPITYHLPQHYAAYLRTMELRQMEHSPKWDGHTPDDVVKRMMGSLRYVPPHERTGPLTMEAFEQSISAVSGLVMPDAPQPGAGEPVTPEEAAHILNALNGGHDPVAAYPAMPTPEEKKLLEEQMAELNAQGNVDLDQRRRTGLIGDTHIEVDSRIRCEDVDAIYSQRDNLALMFMNLAPDDWFVWHCELNRSFSDSQEFIEVGAFVPSSDDTWDLVQFTLPATLQIFLPKRSKALARAPQGYPIGDEAMDGALKMAIACLKAEKAFAEYSEQEEGE